MNSDWDNALRQRLEAMQMAGLQRELKTVSGTGVRFLLNGREVLSFASNDYLGFSAHPTLIAAATAALEQSGAGSRASPLIVGHKTEHARLEAALAKFKQSEAALVFPSGFQAALATLGALAGEQDTIILDRLAHASLIDGAKLSGARVRTFKHNGVGDLASLLQKENTDRKKPRSVAPIIVIESLYSMDGDIAPLSEMLALCDKQGALLLVDEAHATGVLGPSGRGALEKITRTCGGLPRNVIAMGTLSKALGAQGGFICASKLISDMLVHAGRAYLFSTALAPASAAAGLAALGLIDEEPQRRTRLLQMSANLREKLSDEGLQIPPGLGPIIPIMFGDEQRAAEASRTLLDQGLYVPAIRYPTVKKGQARLRVSLSAEHRDADCAQLINALLRITK